MDLTGNPDSIALIESFYNSGKPVAAVCHAPAVLHRLTYKGQPIVKGKRVTGFTNSEEEAVHLTSSFGRRLRRSGSSMMPRSTAARRPSKTLITFRLSFITIAGGSDSQMVRRNTTILKSDSP